MSSVEPYSDEHRIFLQGIMARGILNAEDVHMLLKMACRRCGVEIPVDGKGKMEKLKKFIQTINRELEPMGLQIKKALDEDTKQRAAFFVLCSTYDRSEETSQLTVKAMVDFSPNEIEYSKILMETIIRSEEKEISPTSALNCANYVKNSSANRKFTQQDGEMALKKFVDQKWLKYDSQKNQSQIRLATRFIAEMDPYLKEIRKKGDDQNEELDDEFVEMVKGIGLCHMCKNIVIRSIDCPDCNAKYHLYCIFQTADESAPEIGKCKGCRGAVHIRMKRNVHSLQNKDRKRKSQSRFDQGD